MEYRDIDDYIIKLENIYEPIKNSERDFYQILARLVESIAKCSQYVNKSNEHEIAKQLPTLFAWFCSLVIKATPKNTRLSEILWRKYPNCCPYCLTSPCVCPRGKKSLEDNGEKLQELATKEKQHRPKTLFEWQEMFAKIYPRNPQGYDQKSNFIHLIEEVGEVAEAYRLNYFHPENLNNELADVMTWIFGIANLIDSKAQDNPKFFNGQNSYNLEDKIIEKYENGCPACQSHTCNCVAKDVEDKISEKFKLYPNEVYQHMNSLFLQLSTFQDEIMDDLKIYSEQEKVTLTKNNSEDIVRKLVENSKKKRWYQNISASGITESTIVNGINLLAQTLIQL